MYIQENPATLARGVNHHFSYGTVVQLCVARNRHRLSAKCYKGLAQVTSRRARKGFQLKLNLTLIGVLPFTAILMYCSTQMLQISLP